jgi:predicted small secreted protein
MRSVIMLLGVALVLTACNTVNGIGRDVQSVGETVSDAAN